MTTENTAEPSQVEKAPIEEVTVLRKGPFSLERRQRIIEDTVSVATGECVGLRGHASYWFQMTATSQGRSVTGDFQVPASSAAVAFEKFPGIQQKAAEFLQGKLRAQLLQLSPGLGIKHLAPGPNNNRRRRN